MTRAVDVDRADDAITRIVPPGTLLELVVSGFEFAEGPAWDEQNRRLLFNDITGDTAYNFELDGGLKVLRRPSNKANGNALRPDGSVLTCEHVTRRVVTVARDGTVTTLAGRYEGRRLNGPNDVIVRRDGTAIFTDPYYALRSRRFGRRAEQEQPWQGVYAVTPAGEVTLLVPDMEGPNGLVLSEDERTLFVDDSTRAHVRRFEVDDRGRITGGEVFAEIHGDGPGVLDGMELDREGNLYCTGPGGIWVLAPDGSPLGRIRLPESVANITWAGPDLTTLYATASTSVYRLRLGVPGARHGGPVEDLST